MRDHIRDLEDATSKAANAACAIVLRCEALEVTLSDLLEAPAVRTAALETAPRAFLAAEELLKESRHA